MKPGTGLRSAIAALKTGRPVRVGGERPLTVASVETAGPDMLAVLDADAKAPLLISGWRAAALSLANRRDAADPAEPVLIERSDWLDPDAARVIADPGKDFDRPPLGPLNPLPLEQVAEASAALKLARLAGLLPALWIVDSTTPAAAVSMEAVGAAEPEATVLARARLPLDHLPETQIAVFRTSDDGQEHVALIVGAFAGKPPLVRLHSECLTGDVFGSLKCDCGPQLKEALRLIGEAGGGVLLYLRQEGRGIGIANKIRAYALQDRGLDTVDANLRLGFADDERDYEHAAAMLRSLGIAEVRLLTNNPAKVRGLESAGVHVIERVGHHMPANPHNADYLATKREKSGHIF
ncbi:MAG TPA: GTP cyclohydrolase II [Sphingomicrobium sp.]|nr:GTP cyclohydrolase II [Sphingomicrobium sp.]